MQVETEKYKEYYVLIIKSENTIDIYFELPEGQLFIPQFPLQMVNQMVLKRLYDYDTFLAVKSDTIEYGKEYVYQKIEKFRQDPKACLSNIFSADNASHVQVRKHDVKVYVAPHQEQGFTRTWVKVPRPLQDLITKVSVPTNWLFSTGRADARRQRRKKRLSFQH